MIAFPTPRQAHDAALWLVAASLLMSLAGCTAPPPQPLSDSHATELPNPIQVSLKTMIHTVHYASGSLTPDQAEIGSLNAFLGSSGAERGDAITVEHGASSLDVKRAQRLAVSLTRHGMQPTVSIASEAHPGELQLTLSHYVAGAPNCPNWSKAPGNDFANTLHSDFGCSTANNLAAMIADPRDLVAGRPLAPEAGDVALGALHRYREGKVFTLKDDSSSGSGGGASLSLSQLTAGGGSQSQSGGATQ